MRLVTVDLRWWDTHVKGFESLRLGFLPRFDRAYSALIEDLEQRGLLVIDVGDRVGRIWPDAESEQRRRPRPLSQRLQRRPWPAARCKGGRVVGSSDAKGAFPKANPKTPQDVLATLYHHLGVDAQRSTPTTGRPISVLPEAAADCGVVLSHAQTRRRRRIGRQDRSNAGALREQGGDA